MYIVINGVPGLNFQINNLTTFDGKLQESLPYDVSLFDVYDMENIGISIVDILR